MRLLNLIILIPIVMVIPACLVPPDIIDGKPFKSDRGIIVTRLHSNFKGYPKIPFSDKLEFGFFRKNYTAGGGHFEFEPPKADLNVVEMRSGEYEWTQLRLGTRFIPFNHAKGFTVEPGTVKYIGDLYATFDTEEDGVNIKVTNEVKEIKEELRRLYPLLINEHDLIIEITELL